ncbi:MAG: hypothetical protein EB170_00005 [Nitrosopumilaceae archaeon]|nr:hypothetical protein [Nitrosopumilaceae archaeon]NDB90268.1 hypothetical protein [Nitrososphaerota archaeon]
MSAVTLPMVSPTLNLSPFKKVNRGTKTTNGYKIKAQSLFQFLPYFLVTKKVGMPTMKNTITGAIRVLIDSTNTSSKTYFRYSETL